MEQFLLTIAHHFQINEILFLTFDQDFDVIQNLWQNNIRTGLYKDNMTTGTIFVLGNHNELLESVEYHPNQVWFINENNVEYINHWNIRLDSLVYLLKYCYERNVIIKVIILGF